MSAADPDMPLSRRLVNEVLKYAQAAPCVEVCGLISARDGVPTRFYPIRNIAAEPARHFRMDPAEQIDVMRNIRLAGETLYAIVHSHPTGPAVPSAEDRDWAAYPAALYLIVSLQIDGVLELRAFRIVDGQTREITLAVPD